RVRRGAGLGRQAPGYRIDLDPETLALARFERLVAATEGKDAAARSQLLHEALAIWRGSPLTEFTFDGFAQDEIRRLEELRLRAVEERLDPDLELGHGAELGG